MKSATFILLTAIGMLYFIDVDLVSAQAPEKGCKIVVADLTKRQLSGIGSCTKTMKFKNGKDKAKKMNCILKCVMEKEGILEKSGDLSWDHLEVVLVKEFPESLREKARKAFTPCGELAIGKLDPNPETDEFCKSYDPLLKCMLGNLPNLCSE